MMACNLRSLLVAVIVLSNCITWTASKHHLTHNVHGHRTRHRRQGAGLFLSSSYVIPGGEGTGWGEWRMDSPCSRTCGGGVASQKRICLKIGPDGQPQCRGGDTKYFSCQTQDCPSNSTNFRAEQCAEFNDKDFRGFKYNWVPYTNVQNPCELNCMPQNERFFYRYKPKVIDGTRCNDDSFDVCVDGVCQTVGCDMMLGSSAREDKCLQCRGNGTNCHTTEGLIDSQEFINGYHDLLVIPAGATTIVIEEIGASNNYLALRNKNGTYFLNGDYRIDFPKNMMIAGAMWTYDRSPQGFPAPDKLKCTGPTKELLYLSILILGQNVGVRYEYSVPSNMSTPTDKRYSWVNEAFTNCSASCGGGFQSRNVTCRSSQDLELVDDILCDEGLMPPTNQTCNNDPCPAEWVEGPWSDCSKRCGKEGVRNREVTCQKIIANGYPSIVAEKECFDLYGPKPELFQECNRDAVCPTWFIGRWTPCDKLCDEGKQKRQVVCYQKENGSVIVYDDQDCLEEKPAAEQPCILSRCDGVDWITTEWSGCDTCTSTIRTRVALCASKDQQVYNDSFCAYHNRPVTEEECDKDTLPPCDVQWYASHWSKCSVECGEGVRTRKVFCGLYNETDSSVRQVEDAKCADLPKYNDTKPCEVPPEKCPSQWYAGPWSACSAPCGGGEQFRDVMCLSGNNTTTNCNAATVLDSTQSCNPQPCNPDQLIPMSSKAPSITVEEDYPECEEELEEVGLDELTRTTVDVAMSDGPALPMTYAELESSMTEEGSRDKTNSTLNSESTVEEADTNPTNTSLINKTSKAVHITLEHPPPEDPVILANASNDTMITKPDIYTTDTNVTAPTNYTELTSATVLGSSSAGTNDTEATNITSTGADTNDTEVTTIAATGADTNDTEVITIAATGANTNDTEVTTIAATGADTNNTEVTTIAATGADTNNTEVTTIAATGADTNDTKVTTIAETGADTNGTDVITIESTGADTNGTEATTIAATGADTNGTDVITIAATGADTNDTEVTTIAATGADTNGTEATTIAATGADTNGTDVITVAATGADTNGTEVTTIAATGADTNGTDVITIAVTGADTNDTEVTTIAATGADTNDTEVTTIAATGADTNDTEVTTIAATGADTNGTDVITIAATGADTNGTDVITIAATGADTNDTEVTTIAATGADTNDTEVTTIAATGADTNGTDVITIAATGADTNGTDVITIAATGADTNDTEVTTIAATGADINDTESLTTSVTDETNSTESTVGEKLDVSVTSANTSDDTTPNKSDTTTSGLNGTEADTIASTGTNANDTEATTIAGTGADTNGTEATTIASTGVDTNGTEATTIASTGVDTNGTEATTIAVTGADTNGTEVTTIAATGADTNDTNVTTIASTGVDTNGTEATTIAVTGADTNGTEATTIASTGVDTNGTEATTIAVTGADTNDAEVTTIAATGADTNGTEATTIASTGADTNGTEATTIAVIGADTNGTEVTTIAATGADNNDTNVTTIAATGADTNGTEATTVASTGADTNDTEVTTIASTGVDTNGTEATTVASTGADTNDTGVTTIASTGADTNDTEKTTIASTGVDTNGTEATTVALTGADTNDTEVTTIASTGADTNGTEATTVASTGADTNGTEATTVASTGADTNGTEATTIASSGADTNGTEATTVASTGADTNDTEVTTIASTGVDTNGTEATTIASTGADTNGTEVTTIASSVADTNGTDVITIASTGVDTNDTEATTIASTGADTNYTEATTIASSGADTNGTEVTTVVSTGADINDTEVTTIASTGADTNNTEVTTIASTGVDTNDTEATTIASTGADTNDTEVTTVASTGADTNDTEVTTIASTGADTNDTEVTTIASTGVDTNGTEATTIASTGADTNGTEVTTIASTGVDTNDTEATTIASTGADTNDTEVTTVASTGGDTNDTEVTTIASTGADTNDTEVTTIASTGADTNDTEVTTIASTGADTNDTEVTTIASTGADTNDTEVTTIAWTGADINDTEATTISSTDAETTNTTIAGSSENSTATTDTSESTTGSDFESSTAGGLTTTETIFDGLTTEDVTIVTGRTTWSFETTVGKRMCRPRKKPKCKDTPFGCCPDKKTAAKGPFDEGCLKPHTCKDKEATYGCCPDGVSLAQGENFEGCPDSHCEETLFGCCQSDNKTAAEGNNQEGCPPPPPACASSKYGCCADNETEATGPDAKGCPETEIKTTTVEDISTSESSSPSVTSTESSDNTTVSGTSTIAGDCAVTEFGCCHDNETEASGPDGQGCPCNATEFGCCHDNETKASGPDGQGCPCNATEFGCCHDNETTASGLDGQGCPCNATEFGCCHDNETTASGPDGQGCPCNATEFGCCHDNESTALGPDGQGCPCNATEFGCCHDNETTASGLDGQGCPCNATEFGCCPDGVSPAEGENSKGCPGPCKESTYGCCEDNETPAHGPDFEGCCLLTAYGCCPDNRKPANGPHLEGCGCQDTQHGCCPDKVTIALGANNEGCGCQYTTFGCCPDRHTPASGPDNEGCSCHTYQFGCCPDGVTIANGPGKQSCHCRYSSFGCCGDEETPATAPNGGGCDCSSSKYGCCPDGQTEATGPKFLGCTEVPENKQAGCSLRPEFGPCFNSTVMWYFDMDYGGCSRFWYGGCEGNANRFASKEDCEDVCVQPAPKDACKLPDVKGSCLDSITRWYYNNTREQCTPFIYSGCLGNANNYDSRELCQTHCEPARTLDTCNLPIEQGPCAGNFSSWGYNSESRNCEQFIWGGCEGNSNRFKTESGCLERCNPPGALKPQCSEPQEAGNCSNKEALWSFSQSENRCMPFYYTGCGGNSNNFNSREECEQICPSAYVPDKCTLPAETGECSTYRENWFYDTSIKRCRQFYYGGCGGNENNFATEAECSNTCKELVFTTTTSATTTVTTPAPQVEPKPQTQPDSQTQRQPEPDTFCFNEIDVGGRCSGASEATRYAYDSTLGKCVTFQYLGCGGNQNNFPNEKYCTYYCQPVQDICQLTMLTGPCEASEMQWFYDPSTDSCSEFTYSGCGGNGNRFPTREACEARCRSGPGAEQTTQRPTVTTAAPAIDNRIGEQIPPECRVSSELENCKSVGEVWYLDPKKHTCLSYINQDNGRNCKHTGTYATQESCERSCGTFRGVDVCTQRVDPGPCRAFIPKIYFDQESGTCKQFGYGGCYGGANRFSTIEECEQVCRTTSDVCSLPPEQGDCNANFRQWYFSKQHGGCFQFAYTGCGGNDNRFESRGECESRCMQGATTTTTLAPVAPPEVQPEECRTPISLAPCGSNLTVYFYESSSRRCLASEFGNCRHLNSYRSEEECERRCGAFRGIDVCQERLDTGTCNNPVPKYYYDSVTGSCQSFTYTGCEGGANRFSSIEECEDVCQSSGPAPGCLQELDTGYAEGCAAPSVARYRYDTSRGDCIVFAYKGCGGNDNKFYTYDECRHYCVPTDRIEEDCESYQRECAALECDYGVVRSSTAGGCESCACGDKASHCELIRQECDSLVCPYGVNKVLEDGCERCVCQEDPCMFATCHPTQRCTVVTRSDPVTHEIVEYAATCITDEDQDTSNEVIPECSRYEAECASLQCSSNNKKQTRTANGCVRCECDCEPFKVECLRQDCSDGIETIRGADGCDRCKCAPACSNKRCGAGERCVVTSYTDAFTQELRESSDCRTVIKPGQCPADNSILCSDELKRDECRDDADCRGVGKCCTSGCTKVCLVPETPTDIGTTTYSPRGPSAPVAQPQPEHDVSASEGGKATLRCLFHGNPPPKITWRRGELTIDGNVGRYRLTSDGALEIVSLYRNDTGVYICVADNGLGIATQEINLVVNDPVSLPVGITGDENAVITGELGKPLVIRCLAYGYPEPGVYWEHDGNMVAFNDEIYEIRGNTLLVRSVDIFALGQYTCQAYNGYGKAASWKVTVRAYKPEGIFLEHEYLVPRSSLPSPTLLQPPTTRPTSTTPSTTTTTEQPIFTVPVNTHVSAPYSTLASGTELRLECEVDGYPEPTVHWTKDGLSIVQDERISITGSAVVSRLVVSRLLVSDSGQYGCHASNGFTSHSDIAQINVQQPSVPAKCTDNPFFANCDLIVRSKFCNHKYYSKFCCKSCVEAGQLDPQVAELQGDQPYRKK